MTTILSELDNSRSPAEFVSPEILTELKRIELKTRRMVSGNLLGGYRSAFRGTGLIFSDLREYAPGDDIKKIHWKATARSQHPYVKTFDEDRQLNILLFIDTSRSILSGAPSSRRTISLEFAAVVSILASRSQDSIGLGLFSDELETYLPPRQSRSQLQRIMLTLLDQKKFKRRTNLAHALEQLAGYQRKQSIIFIVSDFHTPDFQNELRALALKHDVVLVCLENETERTIPQSGLVEFRDAETGENLILDTSSPQVRSHLQAFTSRRLSVIKKIAQNSGADFIRICDSTTQPLLELMQRRMARIR